MASGYAEHYNNVRLNSATGYITPKDMLAGHQQEIQARAGSEVGGGEGTAEESPLWSYRRVPHDSEVSDTNKQRGCACQPWFYLGLWVFVVIREGPGVAVLRRALRPELIAKTCESNIEAFFVGQSYVRYRSEAALLKLAYCIRKDLLRNG